MKTIIILLMFLFSCRCYSGVCPYGVKIFYGNGMFNTFRMAIESEDALMQTHLTELSTNPEFDLAYNRNDSKTLNVLSVIVQKLNNNYKTAWRIIFGLEVLPPSTKLDIASLLLEPISGNEQEMLTKYKAALHDGNKVIIVSHSQGNLFAEEALHAISEYENPLELGLGNIRIATPAFSTYNFPYTTFSDDHVVNFARDMSGAPIANLPSIGAGPHPRDPMGHDFVLAYLGTPDSREKIKADIVKVEKQTHFPFPGNAFKIKITSPDEDGLAFNLQQESGGEDDVNISEDDQNVDLKSGTLQCNKIHEDIYRLSLNRSFIQAQKCPCKFSVTVTFNGFEKSYDATFRTVGTDEDRYSVIDGPLPAIHVIKGQKDYEIKVDDVSYPPKRF